MSRLLIYKNTVRQNKENAALPSKKEGRKNLPQERNHVLRTMCQGGALQVLNLCSVCSLDAETGKLTFTFIGTVSGGWFPWKLVEAGATAIT